MTDTLERREAIAQLEELRELGHSASAGFIRQVCETAILALTTSPRVDERAREVEVTERCLLEIEEILQATPERGSYVDDLAQQQDQALIDIHAVSQKALAELRALATTPADPRVADEFGWLVEENNGQGIHWIALATDQWPRVKTTTRRARMNADDDLEIKTWLTPVVRVRDANQAIRFARREDAEAFISLFSKFLLHATATEHAWPRSADPRVGKMEADLVAMIAAADRVQEVSGGTLEHAALYEATESARATLAKLDRSA